MKNSILHLSQQQEIVEELANRLIDRKRQSEPPAMTIPCPHQEDAHLSFQLTRSFPATPAPTRPVIIPPKGP